MEVIILKKYEAIFILNIRKFDDEGESFSKEFGALVAGLGGNMVEAVAMGRNQFTYEIKKNKAGIYFDFVFELAEEKIIEIKNKFRLDERVLRNMIVAYDRPENVVSTLNPVLEQE